MEVERPGGIRGYPLDQLIEEVAFLAYHLHWSHDEVMDLEHRDRRRVDDPGVRAQRTGQCRGREGARVNRHHAFVRAVSDRHRRSVAGVRDVPTALRRLHATWLDRSTHRLDVRSSTSTTWTLRPTVQILVGPAPRSAAGSPAGGRLELVPRRDRPPSIRPPVRPCPRPPVRQPPPGLHGIAVGRPAGQIGTRRGSRIDPWRRRPSGSPARPPLNGRPRWPPYRPGSGGRAPPPRPWSRAPLRRHRSAPGGSCPGTSPGRWRGLPSRQYPPGRTCDRLTDHVVAAIDRRFVAHRERTGRGW